MKNDIFNEEDVAKYFAGELEEKKIEMMEKYFFNDKEKEKEMNEFAKLWDKSTELGKYEQIDVDSDWQSIRQRMGFQTKTKTLTKRQIIFSAAAAVIFLIGLTLVLNIIVGKSKFSDKSDSFVQVVSKDMQKELVLPDSTIIFLNKNASIVYAKSYGKTNREVVLTGEAYFNVQKNKKLPFRVLTEGSTIEVLGTSFNIKPTKDEITVLVITGHVAFYETDKKDNRVDLIQNQQSRYKQTERVFEPVKELDPNLLAWRTHQLNLNRYSAKQTFEIVANYFNLELLLDPALNFTDKGIKGPVNVSSPDLALNDLRNYITSENYLATINGNKLIISRKK